jgi:hypothetical protein
VVMEKELEDNLDRLCEKEIVLHGLKEDRNILQTVIVKRVIRLVASCVGTAF